MYYLLNTLSSILHSSGFFGIFMTLRDWNSVSRSHRAKVNLTGVLHCWHPANLSKSINQLISPTILTLYCLLMPSANFEGWSLYMVLPLELALKPVPIQIFLFTELPLAPLRGGLSLSLWWLTFYMTYKYHFESAFSPVL